MWKFPRLACHNKSDIACNICQAISSLSVGNETNTVEKKDVQVIHLRASNSICWTSRCYSNRRCCDGQPVFAKLKNGCPPQIPLQLCKTQNLCKVELQLKTQIRCRSCSSLSEDCLISARRSSNKVQHNHRTIGLHQPESPKFALPLLCCNEIS